MGCVELTTKWDMASCTKVVATTTAVALLNQWKLLGLDERISADHLLGAAFAANGKADITVLNCLLHNAGFPPDPSPNYWDPAFGCAGAPLPPTESFACSQRIYASLLEQTLANGVGETYVVRPDCRALPSPIPARRALLTSQRHRRAHFSTPI